MLRSLILLLLLAAPAMGAGELRAIVPTGATGVYAVIRNPSNPAQGWDTVASGWAAYDRTDPDQQVALGSGYAVGASDERQIANLPAGLSSTIAYEFDVYDSTDELIGPGVTALYPAVGATVPANVTAMDITGGASIAGGLSISGNDAVTITGVNDGVAITGGEHGVHVVADTYAVSLEHLATGADLRFVGNDEDDIGQAIESASGGITGILADTADMQPKLGTFASGTAAGDIAALPTAVEITDGIWDAPLTGGTHNVPTSAGKRLRDLGASSILSGTVQAATTNSITLDSAASDVDEIYDSNLIVIPEGPGAGQSRVIVEYNGTSKTAIVDRVWEEIPGAPPGTPSTYQIIADHQSNITQHGIAQAGTANTITLSPTASTQNGIYKGQNVVILTSTGTGQARLAVDYDGTTKVLTVSPAWDIQPTSDSVYALMPAAWSIVDSLSTDAKAEINAEAAAALATYDAATGSDVSGGGGGGGGGGPVSFERVSNYYTLKINRNGGIVPGASREIRAGETAVVQFDFSDLLNQDLFSSAAEPTSSNADVSVGDYGINGIGDGGKGINVVLDCTSENLADGDTVTIEVSGTAGSKIFKESHTFTIVDD